MDSCSTVEIIKIQEEVINLMTIYASQISDNSDRTVPLVEPAVLQSISGELANITDRNDTAILPNDLEDTINTTAIILRFVMYYIHLVINKCTSSQ